MLRLRTLLGLLLVTTPGILFIACSASSGSEGDDDNNTGSGGAGLTGGGGAPTSGVGGFNPTGGGGGPPVGDPKTCEQAAAAKTYIGCDFWPTVNANMAWSIFDFAVVVANAGDDPASVTVTRGGQQVAADTVPPDGLKTLYLPWVPELKGPDMNQCTSAIAMTASVKLENGAYHLVSSVPVTVYQFSALEYGPQGGPPGKDWSSCPAQGCNLECFSYTNDASLLLPSTAMTGNYRITGYKGWSPYIPPHIAITGTQDDTNVTVKLTSDGAITAGNGIPAAGPSGEVSFVLRAGEVAELLGTVSSDFSGSLVQADKPVQVISGLGCTNIPDGASACDHIEESVFPAETLGRHYFLTVPTGPGGEPTGHVVRIYGNVDNTALTYPGPVPPNAPSTINAGQVVDLGVVNQDFEIVGDHEFGVTSFQVGATLGDPTGTGMGDPAQSLATAVEQYRKKYIFLAPADYAISYLDMVMPLDASVTLDGAPLGVTPTPISSDYGVARVQLGPGNNGAHVVESTEGVGIQVLGYGLYTSYQYPGGLNLEIIAPPPDDVE